MVYLKYERLQRKLSLQSREFNQEMNLLHWTKKHSTKKKVWNMNMMVFIKLTVDQFTVMISLTQSHSSPRGEEGVEGEEGEEGVERSRGKTRFTDGDAQVLCQSLFLC